MTWNQRTPSFPIPRRFVLTESCQISSWRRSSLNALSRRRRPPRWTTRRGCSSSPRRKSPTMILMLRNGYVRHPPTPDEDSHLCWTSVWGHLTVVTSVKQKRKGLRGSVDLEKIKCVETVEPEPNAPPERMYAFQVNMISIVSPSFQFESFKTNKTARKQGLHVFSLKTNSSNPQGCLKGKKLWSETTIHSQVKLLVSVMGYVWATWDFSGKDGVMVRGRWCVKSNTDINAHNDRKHAFFFLYPQIVYDEGPLYVFAKNEESRSRWIKTLKDSQCIPVNLIIILVFVSARSGWTCSWNVRLNLKACLCAHLCLPQWCAATRTSCRSTIPVPGWTGSGCAATRRSNKPWAARCWIIKMVRMGSGLGPTTQQSPNYLQHGPKSCHQQDLPGTPTEGHPGNLFLRPRQRYKQSHIPDSASSLRNGASTFLSLAI